MQRAGVCIRFRTFLALQKDEWEIQRTRAGRRGRNNLRGGAEAAQLAAPSVSINEQQPTQVQSGGAGAADDRTDGGAKQQTSSGEAGGDGGNAGGASEWMTVTKDSKRAFHEPAARPKPALANANNIAPAASALPAVRVRSDESADPKKVRNAGVQTHRVQEEQLQARKQDRQCAVAGDQPREQKEVQEEEGADEAGQCGAAAEAANSVHPLDEVQLKSGAFTTLSGTVDFDPFGALPGECTDECERGCGL